MKKILSIAILLITLVSCMKDNVVLQNSPHIKTFAFGTHDSVPGLDKITFTVDTFNCLIYNEDSIAFGYSLKKLRPYITFTGSPKKIKVNGVERSKTDSLDFTYPVQYYIQSQNKKNEATYTITLNQHQVNPDELAWSKQQTLHLENAAAQIRTVATTQGLFLFTAPKEATHAGYIYQLSNGNAWNLMGSFENNIQVASIQVFQNNIYALSADGTTLLQLNNTVWENVATFTSGNMADILGEINQKLYILYTANGEKLLASYNGTTLQAEPQAVLPALFCMEGYSKLATNNTIYLIGGTYQGKEQNNVISSDNGLYWTDILNQTGHYTFTPRTQAASAYYGKYIFLVGGANQGKLVTANYLSNNGGYSWTPWEEAQILPQTYQYTALTQAATFNNNLWIIGLAENETQVTTWKGRIRKIDFIKQ